MKKTLLAITLLLALAGTLPAQTNIDWSKLGFSAEPGVSVGTPCVLNLTARFWLGNFGISTCGIYSPPEFKFLSGSGVQADVLYRLQFAKKQPVIPYVALGYGSSNVATNLGTTTLSLATNYIGLSAGAYYMGGFAQLGLGYGLPPTRFRIGAGGSSSTLPVFPLLQIGYVYNIGGSASNKGGGGK